MGLDNLEMAERRVRSQNGEDGVIAAIFDTIDETNRFCVEFGCGDGTECNTAHLLTQGWTGLLMDGYFRSPDPNIVIRNEFITAENIQAIFDRYEVPRHFDLLSIDVDGNDFYIWNQIQSRARVVLIEYNSSVGPELRRTIPYDPRFQWSGTNYYGASLAALAELGRRKAYTLVYCEWAGVNAFFVADEALPAGYVPRPVPEVYRPPNHFGQGRGHPADPTRTMIDPFAVKGNSLLDQA